MRIEVSIANDFCHCNQDRVVQPFAPRGREPVKMTFQDFGDPNRIQLGKFVDVPQLVMGPRHVVIPPLFLSLLSHLCYEKFISSPQVSLGRRAGPVSGQRHGQGPRIDVDLRRQPFDGIHIGVDHEVPDLFAKAGVVFFHRWKHTRFNILSQGERPT